MREGTASASLGVISGSANHKRSETAGRFRTAFSCLTLFTKFCCADVRVLIWFPDSPMFARRHLFSKTKQTV